MANFELGIPAGRRELFTTNSRYQEIRTTIRQLKTDWKPCGACDTRDYTSCPSCRYLGRSLDDTPCCDCSPSGKCGKSYYEPAAFCSHCGRPLTEEAWAKLEKILKGDAEE